jgi:hypothetical protein
MPLQRSLLEAILLLLIRSWPLTTFVRGPRFSPQTRRPFVSRKNQPRAFICELPGIAERLYVFEAQRSVGDRAVLDRFIQ